jgi:hypothetical protein
MKLESLHIGMRVRHPQYGVGTVKALNEATADIQFETGGRRTVAPEPGGVEPAEPHAVFSGLELPLAQFVRDTLEATLTRLGVENPAAAAPLLAARWHGGRLTLHPADPAASAKEVPLETFFHKIVMMRDRLRVLEQKINASELTDEIKVEMQQYITRIYGSLTTFNVLFKNKEDQFAGERGSDK